MLFMAAAFIAAVLFLELFHRREREKIYKYFLGQPKKASHMRHLSPHRKTLDEKRRINK